MGSAVLGLAFIGVISVWPFWLIFSKAGYPGWYALSQLIPVLDLIALFYLALAEWPVQRRGAFDLLK